MSNVQLCFPAPKCLKSISFSMCPKCIIGSHLKHCTSPSFQVKQLYLLKSESLRVRLIHPLIHSFFHSLFHTPYPNGQDLFLSSNYIYLTASTAKPSIQTTRMPPRLFQLLLVFSIPISLSSVFIFNALSESTIKIGCHISATAPQIMAITLGLKPYVLTWSVRAYMICLCKITDLNFCHSLFCSPYKGALTSLYSCCF